MFGGYLEDLCDTPKTLKAAAAVAQGVVGDVTWVRSRETHPGPHSAWFWDGRLTPATARRSPERGEPVELDWRGGTTARISREAETYEGSTVIKSELLPDGRRKLILKDATTGDFIDRMVAD